MNTEDICISKPPKLKNLRTLPNSNYDDSGTNLAVIDLVQTRDFYLELCEELKVEVPDFLVYINHEEVPIWASFIRSYFEILINDQFKLVSQRQFYLYLRKRVEDKGVFIQNFTGVDVSVLRGLAITFKKMPIIGINDDDHYPAKSFTIIHELVHLIKRHSVICNSSFDSFSSRQEEIFCNAVAGEVLVPKEEFKKQIEYINANEVSLQVIEKLSTKFSVSKEVILRRLLDNSYIDSNTYAKFARQIKENADLDKQKRKEQMINEVLPPIKRIMWREAVDKTSSRLSKLIIKAYSEGVIQRTDISRYIGLDYKHISNFISEASKWN